MQFSDRIKSLSLPLDQVVVIGSGLLDQLNLRTARDIDLVVSRQLFESLAGLGEYRLLTKHGELCLVKDLPPLEIWQSWGSGGVANFDELFRAGQTIDGVRFVSCKVLIEQKRLRGLSKDQDDIALLERYNEEHARNY